MRVFLALLAIIFLATLLRFYDLSGTPPGIHGDEAEWGLIEQKVNRGEYTSFFGLGNTGQYFDFSILSYFVQGLFLRIFGDTIFGIRSSSAFAGVATVIAFYFLANLFLKQKLTILIATLAMATSHWHIAYSRLALSTIWTPLFMVLIFYFFIKGIKTKKIQDFLLTGLFLGISLYFYHSVKVIPVILLVFTIVVFIKNHKKNLDLSKKIVMLFVIAAIIFLPQATYYINHPGTFSPRINEVSIFNHIPEYSTRYRVDSILGVLFWQFVNTMKVFNIGGDIGYYFYGYQNGLLAPIIGIISLFGFLITIVHIKEEKYKFILIWFFSVVILGGTLTIDAPSSQRILGVIPVLFLFAGLTIDYLLKKNIPYKKAMLILIVLINGIFDYKIYFHDYVKSQAGWAQREPATQIAYYLKTLGQDWKVYMLREDTWLYFEHGTIRFINPTIEGRDVENSSDAIPLPRSEIIKNVVYIMPPGSPSLDKIKLYYPSGEEKNFINPIGNTPSFTSYEILKEDI